MHGKEIMKKQQLSQQIGMKKIYAFTEKRPIDLSLSENPLGCSPLVCDAFKRLKLDFNDYPAPNGRLLRTKLAQKFSMDVDNFFVANGTESIINSLPRVFCTGHDDVLVPQLTFPMFAVCSELAGSKVISVKMTDKLGIDLPSIFKKISKRTKLIFLCNPNNPTGSLLSKAEVIKFIQAIPKTVLVVMDEANIEFGGESVIDEVANQKNLIILRTLSKGYGLATLRVGFAVANKQIIQKLEAETTIFQVSGISEQLACVALDDDDFIQKTKQVTTDQRIFLNQQLMKLGFIVFPSEANNLFVKIPSFLSTEFFVQKLAEKGISTVLGSSFNGFDDSFFRVSVRDLQTNKMFIQKIKEIVKIAP